MSSLNSLEDVWDDAHTTTWRPPPSGPTCVEGGCVRPVYLDAMCKRHRDEALYRLERAAVQAIREGEEDARREARVEAKVRAEMRRAGL